MKFTTTIVLLLLAIAGAAYLYFIERDKPSTAELQRVEKRVFKDFNPELVTRIALQVARRVDDTGAVSSVEQFEIEREAAGAVGWSLVRPVNFPADETLIRQILDQTKKLDQSRILTGDEYKQLNRAAAGLDQPDLIATFETPRTGMTIRIGLSDAVGWNHYLEVAGQPAVYLVPAGYRDLLALKTDNSAADARRKSVFDISKYDVHTLVLEQPAATIELHRGDDFAWRLTQPLADYADPDKIPALIERLQKLQVAAFMPATNFGRPTLVIRAVQGTVSQQLQIGSRSGDAYPARRSEYQQYVMISAKELEEFMGGADAYRSKLLVVKNDFQDPVHLTQKVYGETLEFELQGKKWALAGAASPLRDEIKVEDCVYQWQDMQITNFAEEAVARQALSNVWVSLAFKFKNINKPLDLALSAPQDGRVYVERTPGIFVALDERAVRAMLKTNELALLADDIVSLPADKIKEVAIARPGGEVKLVRGSNQWAAVSSAGAWQVDADVAADIGSALPVKATACLRKVGEGELSALGLAPAQQSFTFTAANDSATTLALGSPAAGGRHALIAGQPYLFVVSQATVDALKELLEDCAATNQPGR